MSRLIDADVAIENIEEWLDSVGTAMIGKGLSYTGELMGCIEDAPTVDAVHVVRCRECKNYVIVDEFEGGKRYMCLVNHFSYLDNDGDNQFCSYGERRC